MLLDTIQKENDIKKILKYGRRRMDVGKRNFQTVANTGNWLQKPHWRTLKNT